MNMGEVDLDLKLSYECMNHKRIDYSFHFFCITISIQATNEGISVEST